MWRLCNQPIVHICSNLINNQLWCSLMALCRYLFDFRYFWGWSNMFLTWCGGCHISNSAHFVVSWLTASFGVALWAFAYIYFTLDTFGDEATCSSPDVEVVASANSPHFMIFWLTTSFGVALWPFADIFLTLDTFGGEATCSSPDVAAVPSPNSSHL